MGPQHTPLMVYQCIPQFRLIRRMCFPPHICIIPVSCRLINRLPSRTVWLARVHNHRVQDTDHNMGIILHPPHWHHRMGIPLINGRHILSILHKPCQSNILHRRRQLLVLPSINTAETVKFLVYKEKGEESPKVQLDDVLVSASSSVSSKSRFHSSLILCLLSGFHNLVFLL